jgi:hypothetical protein
MFFPRRRPLVRAAMLGGTAWAAHRAGEAAEQERYEEAAQNERLHDLEARPATPAAPATDVVGELTKLKGLLDSGALTQDEFEAAKRKLLGT